MAGACCVAGASDGQGRVGDVVNEHRDPISFYAQFADDLTVKTLRRDFERAWAAKEAHGYAEGFGLMLEAAAQAIARTERLETVVLNYIRACLPEEFDRVTGRSPGAPSSPVADGFTSSAPAKADAPPSARGESAPSDGQVIPIRRNR